MKRALILLSVLASSSVAKAAGHETILTPATPAAELRYGQLVSLDGSRLLAADTQGIKILEASSSGVWTQTAAVAQPGLEYGYATLRGDWAFATAPSVGLVGLHRAGTAWSKATTVADLAYSRCGFDGVTLACPLDTTPAVRVYTAGSTLTLNTTITDSSIYSIQPTAAVSGTTIAVTAKVADALLTFMFVKSGSTWTRQAQLPVATIFPRALALDADRIAIGLSDDSTLRYKAGSVVVFERSGTTWSKAATLLPPDPVVEGQFGGTVSLDGDRLLVGATQAGRFYLFRRIGMEWKLEAGSQSRVGLTAPTVAFDAASMSSSWIAIGTPNQIVSDLKNAGAVFVYPTTCSSDDNCAANAFCGAGGTCLSSLSKGAVCDRKRQCVTGHCADGFCCDLSCDGQCEACDGLGKEGSCLPVSGTPHGKRPACAKAESCGSQLCDGTLRGACGAYVGAEVSCRAKICENGFESSAAVCDGTGTCPVSARKSCDGFACDGDACRTTCAGDADCLGGFSCKGSKCVPVTELCGEGGATVIRRDGTTQDCSPYACRAGACLEECSASNECGPGYLCGGDHRCVGRDDGAVAEDSGGCMFGRRSGSAGIALGCVLAAAALRRRRQMRAAA